MKQLYVLLVKLILTNFNSKITFFICCFLFFFLSIYYIFTSFTCVHIHVFLEILIHFVLFLSIPFFCFLNVFDTFVLFFPVYPLLTLPFDNKYNIFEHLSHYIIFVFFQYIFIMCLSDIRFVFLLSCSHCISRLFFFTHRTKFI